VPDCEWLQIENVALGDTDTTAILVTGDNSTVNLLATELDAELRGGGIPVVVYRGDTAFKRSARVPNVNKVDVEGFEEEVLSGMEEVLAAPALRSVLVRSIS
jgi:FkbM family methyltransferase